MKVLKVLLTLVLAVVALGGAAYAGGQVLRDPHPLAASADAPSRTPATPGPSRPATLPKPSVSRSPSATRSPDGHPSSGVSASAGPSSDPTPYDASSPAVLRPGKPLWRPGDSGDGVRAVQARLRQIAWYYGDVTGAFDAPTVTAVRGFQAKRGIPVTGAVDQRTLDRLEAMTTAPTQAELHNRLPSPGRLDPRCLTGRAMCVDKTSRTLRWVVDGHVELTLDARFGSTVNDTPTREGLFHVFSMDADHVSNLYGSSMPYAMFFSGGQAVHYSSDFAAVGYAGASHGCVNIRDYDGVKWLFSQVRVGDKVVVYWS
jgi:peptidoglycan hydrolase-like protein with peptidoglycan-binding domain